MTRRLAAALLVTTIVSSGAEAQADKYSPVILHLPATPRASVLGNGAGVRDIDAIFSNPALAGLNAGTIAGFARYDAATMVTLVSSSSLGAFNVSIGAQYLDAHADVVRLPFWSYSLGLGGPAAVASAVGSFAMSTTFRGMRVGAALKYVDERAGGLSDGTPSLDLGISRDIRRFTTGLTVQNIGRGIHFAGIGSQLPLRVSAGAAMYGYVFGPLDLGASMNLSVLPDGELRPAAAIEAGYVPLDGYLFQVRAGVRRPELRAQGNVSFGGTASLDRFALDYSWEDWNGGGVHRLALRVR